MSGKILFLSCSSMYLFRDFGEMNYSPMREKDSESYSSFVSSLSSMLSPGFAFVSFFNSLSTW